MYSSWFKGFYSPLRLQYLSLWYANSKVHLHGVVQVKFLTNNGHEHVTIKRQFFRVSSHVPLSCEFSRLLKMEGLLADQGTHLLIGHPSVVFFCHLKQLVKKASWRTKTILGKYNLVQTFWTGLLQQESASKKSYNDHNNNNNNNNNSKLITIKKKLYNFENLIPRTMLHHNKITLA